LQNIIAQHDLEEEYQRLAKASASSSDPLRTSFIAGPSTSSRMGYADAIPFIRKEPEGREPKGNNLPQSASSEVADESQTVYGKQVDDKIGIKPWPSISAFRQWRLSFKKSFAAASKYPEAVFTWITEVETAASMEDHHTNVSVIQE
jgi:hypothetical protein